jgi:hypothetical protein
MMFSRSARLLFAAIFRRPLSHLLQVRPILAASFNTLTGNVLGDPGPAGRDYLTLNINFSQDLSAITLDFATSDFDTPSRALTPTRNLPQLNDGTR